VKQAKVQTKQPQQQNKIGRQISFEDACLLVNGWRDSLALLSCQSKIGQTSVCMRGRMRDIAGLKTTLTTNDGFGEFAFELASDVLCIYADSRDFPDEAKVVCSLFFFFPSGSDPDDYISLSELDNQHVFQKP